MFILNNKISKKKHLILTHFHPRTQDWRAFNSSSDRQIHCVPARIFCDSWNTMYTSFAL